MRIFISYSWDSGEFALSLAERLVSHGIDVVFDKWDLKEGQDKYAFMEKCVNDPEIDKVLIICDKSYTEKANKREGGVGDETVIISAEVYGKADQEKFIPIIAECDEDGKPYCPSYIKSRIYIDLSDIDKYEEEYDKLLRNLYNMPLYKKPKLGSKPEWLEENKENLFPLKDLIHQLKGADGLSKQEHIVNRFKTRYIELLKSYYPEKDPTGEELYESWMKMKEIRDVYLDWLDALFETECDKGTVLCEWFQELYNTMTSIKTFCEDVHSYSESKLEVFKIYIWELFICTIAFLRNYQKYDILNAILCNTYFLKDPGYSDHIKATNYARFRYYSRLLNEQYNFDEEGKKLVTRMGYTLCVERERKPIYSKENLAQADLFLYQVFDAFDLVIGEDGFRDSYWFPICYIYTQSRILEWEMMKSKKYCKKMFALFGVESLDQLKEKISKCVHDSSMRYPGGFGAAPSILDCIKLEDIGSIQ